MSDTPTDRPADRRTGQERRSGYERRAEQREERFRQEVARVVGGATGATGAHYGGRETVIGRMLTGLPTSPVEVSVIVERGAFVPMAGAPVMTYLHPLPEHGVLVLLRDQAHDLAGLLTVGVGVLDQIGGTA